MANEIKFGWTSDRTLTYAAYQPDGTERTSEGTSLVEVNEDPSSTDGTGFYLADDSNVAVGDMIIIKESGVVIAQGIYEDYANGGIVASLSPTGLDDILTTEPTGRATNFREMLTQLYMRFFNKVEKTSSDIIVYNEGGSSEVTTQSHTNVNDVVTVDEA